MKTRVHTSACAWLMAILTGVSSSLSATTVVPAEFGQMARESQTIVHGRVIHVDAHLVGPRRTIESLVTLQIVDTIKGGEAGQTVFRVPGGRVGRYRRVMAGAPQLAAGDEVIVFLKGQPPALPMPYGLSQGVYRVARRGGAATVTPPASTEGRTTRGDPSRRPLTPTAFADQVRLALAGDAAQNMHRPIPRPK